MEWPPKSGRYQEFPEVDRAAWLTIEAARHKIVKGQAPFLDQLQNVLGGPSEVATTSALSQGETVDRDGAFTSRRGPGEGSVLRRQAKTRGHT